MGFFRGNDPQPQPRGQQVEIQKVTDEQIWAAKGSVNMDPGRITGRQESK